MAHNEINDQGAVELATFKGLFEFSIDGISVLDVENNNYIDVNQAKLNLLGYSKEEYLSLNPLNSIAEWQPDGRGRVEVASQHFAKLAQFGQMREELILQKSDGTGIMC